MAIYDTPMIVFTATTIDIRAWLELTREVELLFGAAMADDEGFRQILQRKIDNCLAFCVRENDGPPGTPLCGGLLFSTRRHPIYQIGWLAVAQKWQRCGIGRALVLHVCGLVVPPAEIVVTTFDANTPGGEPSRFFYERLGFSPAELLPGEGPNKEDRQRFRKVINSF